LLRVRPKVLAALSPQRARPGLRPFGEDGPLLDTSRREVLTGWTLGTRSSIAAMGLAGQPVTGWSAGHCGIRHDGAVPTFDELLAEGATIDVSTWGAGFLPGRYLEELPPWEYADVVGPYLHDAITMLDMGTGDASRLLTLRPLPSHTVAYEEWAPTIPAALRALRPAGVPLVACQGSVDNTAPQDPGRAALPFRDATFDLVVNRHESFSPADVYRILRPGGVFVTEQVGSGGGTLRDALGAGTVVPPRWDLTEARRQIESAGLAVLDSGEALLEERCTDVGALVAYLRSVPWELPDFTVARYRERLSGVHAKGEIRWRTGRFWLATRRPPRPANPQSSVVCSPDQTRSRRTML
jgi:SAM-dependent methyltransferase